MSRLRHARNLVEDAAGIARDATSALRDELDGRDNGASALRARSTFIRGLAIGALVGAAIAGSTIWERRRARRRLQEDLGADPDPGQHEG